MLNIHEKDCSKVITYRKTIKEKFDEKKVKSIGQAKFKEGNIVWLDIRWRMRQRKKLFHKLVLV